MKFRTTFAVETSPEKINYKTPVFFTGSCFANEIGSKMAAGKMPVLINPSGTTYNPASMAATLSDLLTGRLFTNNDLLERDGNYFSFSHYTSFTSNNREELLYSINSTVSSSAGFLKSAEYLFLTFGTARIYRYKKTGNIVSNCHKLPENLFDRELLTVNEVVRLWTKVLDDLISFNPRLRVIFTVSPVRHWKDGAHGNQVSKSVLFLAIEELMSHRSVISYFPAYELLIDDLRDYRFYADDMLHPSEAAVNYIWDAFTKSFFEPAAIEIHSEVSKINTAMNHRIMSGPRLSVQIFARTILKQIESISKRLPGVDFSREIEYFQALNKS